MNAPHTAGTDQSKKVADFLGRVVPWPAPDEPGYCNLHWFSPKQEYGMNGRPYRTLVDFMTGVDWAKTHPATVEDIYFCLSQQREVGKIYNDRAVALRNKGNTTGIKCIVLDVDVKAPPKGYTNIVEAFQAIAKFVRDANLPLPTALVHSGGGIHVYWISDRILTLEEWAPYATGLRALADTHGLRFDAAVTIDCVRVLRVPGTFNHKQAMPRPVRLLTLAANDYTFETSLGHIRGSVVSKSSGGVGQSPRTPAVTRNATRLPKRTPPAILSTAAYRAEIGTVFEQTPLDPHIVLKECPFFRETIRTKGIGQEQGLWMQTALASTFLYGGREIFHELSRGHAGYTPAETDEMFDRKMDEREEIGLRWPSCQAFEQYGSKQCAACQHKDKIKSPLNLARPQPTPPAEPSFVDPYAEFAGPAFPVGVLPPTLVKFVDAQHRAMGADPSAIAMAALTTLAGAMHAEARVLVGEGWWERSIIWAALVGQPSTMKSPIIAKATKPLIRIDQDRDKSWRQEYAKWQQNNHH
jgi:hypothetical protein